MIEAWSAEQVRAAEAPLVAAGVPLMTRASAAVAAAVVAELRAARGAIRGARVALLVGGGNNGGDALFAGALLSRRGVVVSAYLVVGDPHPAGADALQGAGGCLVRVVGTVPGEVAEPTTLTLDTCVAQLGQADVIVDGLLGIGARGPLRGVAARLVEALGHVIEATAHERSTPGDPTVVPCVMDPEPPRVPGRRSWPRPPRRPRVGSRPRVVAVDVPSGIGVDDGSVPGPVLAADRTVTFGGARVGLVLPPAAFRVGEVTVADIGLSMRGPARVQRLEPSDVGAAWPVPGPSDHKYTRGVVGVVAGSPSYPGAAVLATSAAVRTGAGLVRYVGAVPGPVLAARPEVVTAVGRVQSWVVGPGLPLADEGQHDLVRSVLRSAVGEVPIVVDAGALALLPDWVPPSVVLTPHAGELAQVLGRRGEGVERSDVEAEPLRWASRAHALTGATVVLKGAVTVIVGGGAAPVVYAQADGPHWLATAGAGDVLAGLLGAMLASAQAAGSLADPADPARIAAAAALVHGRAGVLAGPGPIAALDVADAIPAAIVAALAAAGRTP